MTFRELLFGSDRFSPKQERYRMFFMYALTGVFTMIANAASFVIFDKLVTTELHVTVIMWSFDAMLLLNQFIAWIAAVLTAFFTNRAFVFRSHGNIFLELLGFTCARLISFMLIEVGLFTLMIMFLEHTLGIPQSDVIFRVVDFEFTYLYVVKILNSLVLVAANYVASRYLVFKATGKDVRKNARRKDTGVS